ncbi:xanthine dehydrogenase [Nostoc sphaeroides CCNUC1]|uniref:Xanthine dehydrogenase n=1 Tax=Nostoc sphaeroides CCNUC1 TaxID=2653204 RepID=A0A5P8WF80_9NOSO|nr:xanthine dehydrogenase [Nostoc sphaeroides CCNUC1]
MKSQFIQQCFHQKHLGIIATVFALEGTVKVKLGSNNCYQLPKLLILLVA